MTIRHILSGAAAALLALSAASAARAFEVVEKGIRIVDPWTPATLRPNLGNAVYMLIVNETAAPVHLTGVKSAAARANSLHVTVFADDGVTRMLRIIEVEILPGESLVLEPEAMHIMMTTLAAPLVKDQTVPVTLTFRELGDITVDVMVEGATAMEPRERPNPPAR